MEKDELLYDVVESGDLLTVKRLLDEGVRPYHEVFEIAVEEGHTSIFKCLIETKANIDAFSHSIFGNAAWFGELEIVEYLMKLGVNIHAWDDGALQNAAANGHLEVIEMLLEAKADVHANNDNALRQALKQTNLAVVECLLEHGATFDERSGIVSEKMKKFCMDYQPTFNMKSALKK